MSIAEQLVCRSLRDVCDHAGDWDCSAGGALARPRGDRAAALRAPGLLTAGRLPAGGLLRAAQPGLPKAQGYPAHDVSGAADISGADAARVRAEQRIRKAADVAARLEPRPLEARPLRHNGPARRDSHPTDGNGECYAAVVSQERGVQELW